MFYSTHYRSLKDDFTGQMTQPTVSAPKDNGFRSRASPSRLSSLKGKVKNLTKIIIFNYIYICLKEEDHEDRKTEDTDALGR